MILFKCSSKIILFDQSYTASRQKQKQKKYSAILLWRKKVEWSLYGIVIRRIIYIYIKKTIIILLYK